MLGGPAKSVQLEGGRSAREGTGDKRTYEPPQRVMSNIKLWGAKNWLIEHDVEGQLAVGVPNVDVSRVLAFDEMLLGTL